MKKTQTRTAKKINAAPPIKRRNVPAPRPAPVPAPAQVKSPGTKSHEAALKVVDIVEKSKEKLVDTVIEEKALSLPDRARTITITDAATRSQADSMVQDVVAIRKEITAHYSPLKDAAYKAHRLVCEAEAKVLSPVADAERIIKQAIGHWDTEQTRLENERRRKNQEADDARRQQEVDKALADAEEKSALEIERLVVDEGLTVEEAMERVNPQARAQVAVASVPMSRTVTAPSPSPGPKPRATTAANYTVEITDMKELCGAVYRGEYTTELVEANMPILNGLARTLKETFRVPGCRLVKGETVTVR